MIKPAALNQDIFHPLWEFGTCEVFTGIRLAVGEGIAVEVAVGARAVAVSSEAFGVDVRVMVGAPKFVGVGEYECAMDVDVRNEAFAVPVIWAATVPCSGTVGVGEKTDVAVGVPGVDVVGVSAVPVLVGDETAGEEGVGVASPGWIWVAVFAGGRVAVERGVAVDLDLFVFVGGFWTNSASSR